MFFFFFFFFFVIKYNYYNIIILQTELSKSKNEKQQISNTMPPVDPVKTKQTILNLMISSNRPFNTQQVSDHTAGTVKKPAAQIALDTLTEEGVIEVKAFGKNKVYYAKQSVLEKPDPEKLQQLEKEVTTTHENIQQAQLEQQKLLSRLAEVRSYESEETITADVNKLKGDIIQKKKTLETIQLNSKSSQSPECARELTKKIQLALHKSSRLYRQRKRKCMEALETICGISDFMRPHDMFIRCGLEEDSQPPPET